MNTATGRSSVGVTGSGVKGFAAGLVALRAKVNDTRQVVTATRQMAVAAFRMTA
jgi:hypothetical protein